MIKYITFFNCSLTLVFVTLLGFTILNPVKAHIYEIVDVYTVFPTPSIYVMLIVYGRDF